MIGNKNELKQLIEKDIAYSEDFIKGLNTNENPLVKEMVVGHESRIYAMNTVLNYINNGSKILFNK